MSMSPQFAMSDKEEAALEQMASLHEVPKIEIMKRAFSLYMKADAKRRGGEVMAFVDSAGTIDKQENFY